MNPIFLKVDGLRLAFSYSKHITDKYLDDLQIKVAHGKVEMNLDKDLHKWSVESTLASLYGDNYDKCLDLDTFVENVHQMFASSANLQTQSAQVACQDQTKDWIDFCNAAHGSLDFMNDNLSNIKDGLSGELAKHFSPEEVTRIANDLIIAAADTTSYTTLWTLYCFARNPGYQYGDALMVKEAGKESMRLFPVAPFLTRHSG
jgi:cytochrome P450